MSSLGWYQWITTASKKVGGPLKLLALIGGTCFVAGGTIGNIVTNKYRDIKDKKELKSLGTCSVLKDAEIKKIKLILKPGDKITVFAVDNDSILIARNGDKNALYFVSSDFLKENTDYKRL